MWKEGITFLPCLYKCTGRVIALLRQGCWHWHWEGIGINKMFNFTYFYMLGKTLSGKLSCTWTGLVQEVQKKKKKKKKMSTIKESCGTVLIAKYRVNRAI